MCEGYKMNLLKMVICIFGLFVIFLSGCSDKKSNTTDDSGNDGIIVGNDDDGKLPGDDSDLHEKDGENDLDDSSNDEDQDDHSSDKDGEKNDDGLEPDGMGPGTENAYDPGSENADGISVDDNGYLIIDDSAYILRYLWVSNSEEGTVSKIDTFTREEVARYAVGLNSSANPSRTSVDLAGNVFVGNRVDGTVTKIAGNLDACIDRNSNGTIETSTGGDNVLPRAANGRSTDECVLWTRRFVSGDLNPPHACSGIRAVAATPETGENYEYTGHVWIGCAIGDEYAYKLNGNTGNIMEVRKMTDSTDTNYCRPYGFVLDHDQRLWTSCRAIPDWQEPTYGGIAYFDTENPSGGMIYTPDNINPYGIAIDGKNRIWVTGFDGTIHRYTPSGTLLDEGIWHSLTVSEEPHRGIAVDKWGFVWAITTEEIATPTESRIHLIDGDAFPDPSSILGEYGLSNTEYPDVTNGTGVAVDFQGHIWGVSRNHGDPGHVTFIEVDRSGENPQPVIESKTVIPVGVGPYVYSDMLGYNLRNFGSREGWYRHTFQICDTHETTLWEKIYWEAEVPEGTRLVIRARAADLIDDLPNVEWITVVEVPDDISPKDLPNDLPNGHYIELEARLYSIEEGVTPKVGMIHFDYVCRMPY
jgi:hypothetical protein